MNPCRIAVNFDQRPVGKLEQSLLLSFEDRLVLFESPGDFVK